MTKNLKRFYAVYSMVVLTGIASFWPFLWLLSKTIDRAWLYLPVVAIGTGFYWLLWGYICEAQPPRDAANDKAVKP